MRPSRSASILVVVISVASLWMASGCATSHTPAPKTEAWRLPGLPWGSSTPAVTAVLVKRGFRFVGRNGSGDLRFDDGRLLGHEASLVARMHRDGLVKVVAFLEPHDSQRMYEEIDSIAETLRRFYGPPSFELEPSEEDPPRPEGKSPDPAPRQFLWLEAGLDDRPYGVRVRLSPRPAYRIDFESPAWPAVYAERRKDGNVADALSVISQT